MNKPDTVALRERANYYDSMTARAREIVRLLNEWLFYAEHGLKDGVDEELARWEETVEQLEWMAEQAFRKLDRIEAEEKEA